MKHIVLTGFMGTGKTEVGRKLSQRLQWSFLDTDSYIVRAAGKSIPRIFAEDGEPAFRSWETRTLQELAGDEKPKVIATGGGIVLADHNWPLLHALGTVVCLTAEPEEIFKRLGNAAGRPLLAGTPEEVRARIQALLAQRAPAYAKADWTCRTDGQTPDEVAGNILQRVAF